MVEERSDHLPTRLGMKTNKTIRRNLRVVEKSFILETGYWHQTEGQKLACAEINAKIDLLNQ